MQKSTKDFDSSWRIRQRPAFERSTAERNVQRNVEIRKIGCIVSAAAVPLIHAARFGDLPTGRRRDSNLTREVPSKSSCGVRGWFGGNESGGYRTVCYFVVARNCHGSAGIALNIIDVLDKRAMAGLAPGFEFRLRIRTCNF
jgi:hypothetical protein